MHYERAPTPPVMIMFTVFLCKVSFQEKVHKFVMSYFAEIVPTSALFCVFPPWINIVRNVRCEKCHLSQS